MDPLMQELSSGPSAQTWEVNIFDSPNGSVRGTVLKRHQSMMSAFI